MGVSGHHLCGAAAGVLRASITPQGKTLCASRNHFPTCLNKSRHREKNKKSRLVCSAPPGVLDFASVLNPAAPGGERWGGGAEGQEENRLWPESLRFISNPLRFFAVGQRDRNIW